MKRTLIAIAMALALVLIPVGSAFAATTADVTVTATPGFVSITNAPDSWDAGTIIKDTDVDTGVHYFTITNASTVAMDINIACDGWTSWTYGAPATDTGQLKASSANGGTGGSTGEGDYDITVPNGGGSLLCNGVAVSTNPTWELQLDAPTDFTNVDVQTSTVTLTASVD
jgi:hypothetical protein